jgi:hypothetical protein
MEIAGMQRKSATFLQAVADIRYCAFNEREAMVRDAVFESKPASFKKAFNRRYLMDADWSLPHYRIPFMNGQNVRNQLPYLDLWKRRLSHGYEIPNI